VPYVIQCLSISANDEYPTLKLSSRYSLDISRIGMRCGMNGLVGCFDGWRNNGLRDRQIELNDGLKFFEF